MTNLESSNPNFLLSSDDKGLSLKYIIKDKKQLNLRIDFTSKKMLYRIKSGGGRKQAIAKAVGLKHGKTPTILDITAGLGRDAFILASLGCSVTLIERSPILCALLKDGLKRAANYPETSDIVKRMILVEADAIDYMKQLSIKPDIIYLDPMFPKRTKKASVKKEMQILQKLLSDKQQNTELLLTTAIKYAQNRVVVKRPRLVKSIGNLTPSTKIIGKSCRFDVYM